jgi:hypothetical protein
VLLWYSFADPHACVSLGNASTAAWAEPASDRVTVSYTNGSQCVTSTTGPQRMSVTVEFRCNCSMVPGGITSFSPAGSTGACAYHVVFDTNQACRGMCPTVAPVAPVVPGPRAGLIVLVVVLVGGVLGSVAFFWWRRQQMQAASSSTDSSSSVQYSQDLEHAAQGYAPPASSLSLQ